jgi:CRISPR-associated endoribonuclease Cas6
MLGSAVYRLLQECSDEAADVLHESPHRSAYVLSEIHRVRGKPKEYWFRLGTGVQAVGRIAKEAFPPGTRLRIGPTEFEISNLSEKEPIVRPGEFVTLSPILLRDRKTRQSLVYDSPQYKDALETAARKQVKNNLAVEDNVRIRYFESQGVRKRTIERRTVLAQKGRFLLEASEDSLRLFVNHGLGLSPALAFGMVVPTEGRLYA